ncbi:LysR family transcriptional regulator [Cupriavidus sp. UGS-1]|uniref:LysR family transcriptional regulator n=1 Tax=Cupriavidus sp. UGS-1 TaxID=2899826 RepID=UPI001E360103|nr:LysR family transcriptional regulator [Cupriavidus sp. UGS-1]MCD9120633.1 LysR family transcriptional regulator [Cupriavidus sp. UGS-1]
MRTSLTLKQLEAILAIAKHGNFTAAAEHLHVSQPALSRIVRLAEESLGTRIFDRDTRSVTLTPEGEELIPIATRVLDEFNESTGELYQFMEGKRGRVRVSALPSIAQYLLLDSVKRYCTDYPGVGFTLRVDTADQILALLERREIDVGLGVQPPPDGRFNYRHLYDDHFVLVCPRDDALNDHKTRDRALSWRVFASRPFIAVTPGTSTRAATDAAFIEAGVTIRPVLEVASMDLQFIGGLVASGLGLTALPRSTFTHLGQAGLAARSLNDPVMQRRIGILSLAGRSMSTAVERFCSYVEQNALSHVVGD